MTPDEYLEERVNSGCDFGDESDGDEDPERDYLKEAFLIIQDRNVSIPGPCLYRTERKHIIAMHNHDRELIRTYQKLVDQMREILSGKGRVA